MTVWFFRQKGPGMTECRDLLSDITEGFKTEDANHLQVCYSSLYSRCQWDYVVFCCKMCCKLYRRTTKK